MLTQASHTCAARAARFAGGAAARPRAATAQLCQLLHVPLRRFHQLADRLSGQEGLHGRQAGVWKAVRRDADPGMWSQAQRRSRDALLLAWWFSGSSLPGSNRNTIHSTNLVEYRSQHRGPQAGPRQLVVLLEDFSNCRRRKRGQADAAEMRCPEDGAMRRASACRITSALAMLSTYA